MQALEISPLIHTRKEEQAMLSLDKALLTSTKDDDQLLQDRHAKVQSDDHDQVRQVVSGSGYEDGGLALQ